MIRNVQETGLKTSYVELNDRAVNEPSLVSAEIATRFKLQLFDKNLGILKSIDFSFLASDQKDKLLRDIPRLELLREYYAPRLEEIVTAPEAERSLQVRIPDLSTKKLPIGDGGILQMKEIIDSGRDEVIISNSHLSTYYLVSALGASDLGLVILDHHLDIYQSVGESSLSRLNPTKGNFLRILADSGKIRAFSLLGVGQKDVEQLRTGSLHHAPLTPTADAFKRLAPKMFLASENELADHWRAKTIDQLMAKQMDFFLQKKIKRFIFSIDVDSLMNLRHGYTAMEFSPLSFFLSIGIQDFQKAFEYAESESLTQTLQDRDGFIKSRAYELMIQALDWPILRVGDFNENTVLGYSLDTEGRGVSLATVGKIIDRSKRFASQIGIEFGVATPKGGKVLGDVVEFEGFDFHERTAKAVSGIINRIAG